MIIEHVVVQAAIVLAVMLYLQRRRRPCRPEPQQLVAHPAPDPDALAIGGTDFYVRIGAVIWLSFQKRVDAFEYQRWSAGALERHLAYGCHAHERTWERVAGRPEPWETAALGPLTVGGKEPSIDGRAAAAAVAAAYGLLGWE